MSACTVNDGNERRPARCMCGQGWVGVQGRVAAVAAQDREVLWCGYLSLVKCSTAEKQFVCFCRCAPGSRQSVCTLACRMEDAVLHARCKMLAGTVYGSQGMGFAEE